MHVTHANCPHCGRPTPTTPPAHHVPVGCPTCGYGGYVAPANRWSGYYRDLTTPVGACAVCNTPISAGRVHCNTCWDVNPFPGLDQGAAS